MAAGRILVVHESAATRSLLADLLTREGMRVDAAETTFDAMARFVDEPADLVILGLGDLVPTELQFITTLRNEKPPPKILVTFASPRRDLAVRALALGATGYANEPFYNDEILGLVRGQLAAGKPAAAPAHLARLAHEVAHTINNPLQIIRLLFEKERVTKRELMTNVPKNLARVEAIVAKLRAYGTTPSGTPGTHDPLALVTHAADDANVILDAGEDMPSARLHPANFSAALEDVFTALRERVGEEAPLTAVLGSTREHIAVRIVVPRVTFEGEKISDVLDLPFVVREDRDIYASMARARVLLESMGGSLSAEQQGERIAFVVRLARAEPSPV